jgi:hypothetical protein
MRILSLVVTLLAVTTLSAQRLDYLTFRLLNGNEQSLNIAQGALLTFSGDKLVVLADSKQTEFALADLNSLFFATEPTGINDVTSATVAAAFNNGNLQVTAPAGSIVKVYNLDGRSVATLQKSTNGNERFSLPLSKGVYVVRIGQQTFKLLAQ